MFFFVFGGFGGGPSVGGGPGARAPWAPLKSGPGHTWLHGGVTVLAACNNVAVLELLCQRGADLSLVDQDGATTVHYAAQLSTSPPGDWPAAAMPTLRTLLSASADPDSRDEDGRTPLMWAATSGNYHT